jgi:hypothetical protein
LTVDLKKKKKKTVAQKVRLRMTNPLSKMAGQGLP